MRVQTATGERAAVASGHPAATEAAIRVLQDGGNVVDAAIAGAAVLSVALPQACSLGSDCFALVHVGGKTFGLNGSGPSPQTLPADVTAEQLAWGPLSCATPGMLGGWEAMHRRFGRTPWRSLLAPAAAMARNGFPVGRELAAAMRENLERLRL